MQFTRRSVLAASAASSIGWTVASAAPRETSVDLKTLIDQAKTGVRETIDRHGMVGVAACLVVDGAPLWVEPFGSTGGANSRTIDANTIFSLQSTSKNVAATAIMLAVQRGLLDLDAPISTYLPEFRINSRLEEEPVSLMSLRHLLSHHAGLTHEAPVGNNFIADSPSFEAHAQSIQETWLRYRVGERYSYSNLGVDLAGYVLERVAKMPYAECLRRWVFEPLEMHNTTASADTYEANQNRAIGHTYGFDQVPVRIPIVPSGGVYTSLADFTRYAQFHLNQGRAGKHQLLDQRLWHEMHAFRYGGEYALGVARYKHRFADRAVDVFGHNGGGFGFGSCLSYCPAERVAWIVLFNGATKLSDGPLFDFVMPQPLLQKRYGPEVELDRNTNPQVSPPIETLRSRVGLYMNGDTHCDVSVINDALCLQFKDQPGVNRLSFVSGDEAWVSDGPRKLAGVKFHPALGLEAQHFELPEGVHWDFIDGPSVPPGPVGAEYDEKLGDYVIYTFGKAGAARSKLAKQNGYIYFNDIRLSPFLPGLLFSGEGEAMDLRGQIPTARNIQLIRV